MTDLLLRVLVTWGIVMVVALCAVVGPRWWVERKHPPQEEGEWCSLCDAPQWVTPDGEHHCGEDR